MTSNEEDKGDFYSKLLTIIQDCPKWYIIIVGDFSAKISTDNTGYYEEGMGQRGLILDE